MNKYPLDNKAVEDTCRDLLMHDRAQAELIRKLSSALSTLLEDEYIVDTMDEEELEEMQDLVRGVSKRKLDFETHRFNQQNGHAVANKTPYENTTETLSIGPIDLFKENQLNALEAETFGVEMTEEELASHFQEPKPKKKKEKPIHKMTLEEIESWEKAQDNSNEIYKLSARIKNLARSGAGANLTPAGDVLCNSYTHVMKSFYNFAETIQDKDLKIKLHDLVRANEGVPAQIIAALGAGVRTK